MVLLASTSTCPGRLWRRAGSAALLLILLLSATGAGVCASGAVPNRPNDPALTLAADQYGYQPVSQRFLAAGLSMLTLNFVDNTHLLFTFHTHGLMPRLPDAAPDDNDRHITAVLIELPSGKEVARTVWRTRDQDQYLWPLSHGRFLLRIRSKLTVLDPMRGLAAGNPFFEQPFLEFKRRIGYIAISPGGELLSVETLPPQAQHPEGASAMDAVAPATTGLEATARAAVEVHFYRLSAEGDPGKPQRLIPAVAGILLTRTMIHIPATAEGYIDITQDGTNGFLFDFLSHTGERKELSGYATTCVPRSYFISRSEFVAFGCELQDKVILSEFDLRGQQPWVQVLSGAHIVPTIISAPDAGRFVLSRILVNGTYIDMGNILPDELSSQELTVMQNHDGRLLLKTQASPIERSGQNFDLSEDGLSFATVQTTQVTRYGETTQNTKIVVFRLPALTPADEKEVKLEAGAAPEKNNGMVRLFGTKPQTEAETQRVTVQTGTTAVVPIATPVAPGDAQPTAGDADPDGPPRKPPSLYGPDHPKEPPPPDS
jgi:hypothetical protein